MNTEKIKQNKVGSIFKFAIPATVGMLMTSLITIVDGYFAGNFIGSNALVAINLGLPILYLYLAIGLMIGVGGSVISGMAIGNKDSDKANKTFTQTMVLTVIVGILISVIIAILFEPILRMLKAEEEVAQMFRNYYSIFLISAPLMIIDSCYGMFLRADGEPHIYMAFNGVSIILNAFLDFLFTAKLGFGIRGLIIASLISLALSTTLSTVYFIRRKGLKSEHVLLKFVRFKWSKETVGLTFANGVSEFIGEMASCISMFCYNYVLMKYVGKNGVAAFTVLGYSVYVFNMIAIGFGEGMSPLVSFCFGSGENRLCRDLRKITNRIVFVIGTVFAVSLFFGARLYSSFFLKDQVIIDMVVRGFKIFAIDFMLQGFNVIGSMYLTSCGKAKDSAIISFARGIFILLITIFVFSALWGIDGVWMTSPVTEVLTLIITVTLCIKDSKKENFLEG